MSYILLFIFIYFTFKVVVPSLLTIFSYKKSSQNLRSKRQIRSKINKMNIQDAEFDEK